MLIKGFTLLVENKQKTKKALYQINFDQHLWPTVFQLHYF